MCAVTQSAVLSAKVIQPLLEERMQERASAQREVGRNKGNEFGVDSTRAYFPRTMCPHKSFRSRFSKWCSVAH